MRHRTIVTLLAAAALSTAEAAQAQTAPAEEPPARPTQPPPNQAPPAPPENPGAPPPAQEPVPERAQAVPALPAPGGQWVYTSQHGWLWMPYARSYTYVPPEGVPQTYVYDPAVGWRWVVAPWVFGWGPAPYWGAWGPRYYVWHARPWFRVPPRVYPHRYRHFAAPVRPHRGGYHRR